MLRLVYEMSLIGSHVEHLIPQLVVLFWKVLETLGGRAT